MIVSRELVKSWRWRVVKAEKTIEDLAIATDLNANQISNYIAGRTDPGFEKVCKVEAVLATWGVEYQP